MSHAPQEPLDLFDPWTEKVGEGTSHGSPGLPASPDPGLDAPRYLREVGAAEVQSVFARLTARGHHGTVQDLLDQRPPVLRAYFSTRAGPMSVDASIGTGTLEFTVEEEGSLAIAVARFWLGEAEVPPSLLGRIPTPGLSPAWIRERVTDFVELVLDRI